MAARRGNKRRRAKDRTEVREQLRDAAPDLEEMILWWQRRTPYPQFLWVGIWRPQQYDAAQRLIAAGPETWQQSGRVLVDLVGDWADDRVDARAVAVLDACAQGKLLRGEAWMAEYLPASGYGVKAALREALEQYRRDCGNFFHLVARNGLVRAAVAMADNESYDKPHRRFERLATALGRCVPAADERLRLFEAAVTQEPYRDIRRDAIALLPRLVPASEQLAALLRGLLRDADSSVRFWTAYHLTRVGDPARDLVEPLLAGFGERMTWGYDSSADLDAQLTIEALERLGPEALAQAARFLAAEGRWDTAARCCAVLARHPGAVSLAVFTDLRARLLAEVPAHWVASSRLRSAAGCLLERAVDRLGSLCWHHDAHHPVRFQHLRAQLRRAGDGIPLLVRGWDDGESLLRSLRGVHRLLHAEEGDAATPASTDEVERLLEEVEALLTQVRGCEQRGMKDPDRVNALRDIEEELWSAAASW